MTVVARYVDMMSFDCIMLIVTETSSSSTLLRLTLNWKFMAARDRRDRDILKLVIFIIFYKLPRLEPVG
jgi:hypothetical protein